MPDREGALAYPGPRKQIATSANWYSFSRPFCGYDGLVMRYVGFRTASLTCRLQDADEIGRAPRMAIHPSTHRTFI